MATAASLSLALPTAPATVFRRRALAGAVNLPALAPARSRRTAVRASAATGREGALAGIAAVAALVVPEIAEAAQPGISPSLRNFLLSILSGGVVIGVLAGAVIAVANFDPVKRS